MSVLIEAEHYSEASPQEVWAVLADFYNIADWNSSIKNSYATAGDEFKAGTKRRCELSPIGTLDETLLELKDGEKMVISVDKTAMVPVKSSVTTFAISPGKNGGTDIVASATVEPQGFWPISKLLELRFKRRLPKALKGTLTDLAKEASKKK